MLQACPEIHCNRTNLNLNLCVDNIICQKNRDGYDHMITHVSVWLWICDIILYTENRNVILIGNRRSNPVNIRRKRTDNADTGYVIHIFDDVLHSQFKTFLADFAGNALRRFDAGGNMLNRVILVCLFELVV